MKRYYYYLFGINLLVNVLAFVPYHMFGQLFKGTVMGMLIGSLLGTLLLLVSTYCFNKFPGQGIPEIMKKLPLGWLRAPILIWLVLMWYTAGCITLYVFASFTQKFLNPDIPISSVIVMYVFVAMVIARMRSDKILYTLEIMLFLSVPLILFILAKSYMNQHMNWSSVFAVLQFYNKTPSLLTIAAGSYVFSGYANLVIFNRHIKLGRLRWLWIVPLAGAVSLFTSIFVPVGFLGADGVNSYLFPWVTTADSMRVELGFVERVVFIFLFLYGELAFVSIIVHWHVALELMRSAIPMKRLAVRYPTGPATVYMIVFAIAAIAYGYRQDDNILTNFGRQWLVLRLPGEIFLMLLLVWAVRRRSKRL